MKRFLVFLLIMGIVACLFGGCTSSDGSSTTTPTIRSTTATSAISNSTNETTTTGIIIGLGGDDFDYGRSYLWDFSVESALEALVDKEAFDAWCSTFEHFEMGGTRNKYEFNIYTLIKEFSIPREAVEEICRQHKIVFPDDIYLTDEQVEILYTGTEVEVYQYFANPHAVLVGKYAYSPKWMVKHTAEDYLAEGITYEILSAEMDDLLVPCNEKERDYLRTQLAALKELEE